MRGQRFLGVVFLWCLGVSAFGQEVCTPTRISDFNTQCAATGAYVASLEAQCVAGGGGSHYYCGYYPLPSRVRPIYNGLVCEVTWIRSPWGGESEVPTHTDPFSTLTCGCPPGKVKDTSVNDRCIDPALPKGNGPSCPSTPNPIHIGTGNKWVREIDVDLGGMRFARYYNSNPNTINSVFGALWSADYAQRLSIQSSMVAAHRAEGKIFVFTLSGSNYIGEADVSDRLYRETDGGGNLIAYRLETADQLFERYDLAGRLLSVTNVRGHKQSLSYDVDSRLIKVIDEATGRVLRLTYDAQQRIARVTDAAGQQIDYAYDAANNLASVTYPDTKVKTYHYNEAAYTGGANLPNALTGISDENGSRHATYMYDSTGRATGEYHAGGVNNYQLVYGDNSTSLTDAAGVTRLFNFQNILSVMKDTGSSQPAGSGCGAASSGVSYDLSGNALSRDDFAGNRTCYAYDGSNRETVRVAGLSTSVACSSVIGSGAALPVGARKTTTTWHPDWRVATLVNEPLRKVSTVYHGQPDPFNSNVAANCSTAAVLPNGRPVPLVCKQVEQAMLSTGAADPAVPARTTTYTYDAAGRMLTSKDSNNQTTSYSYYVSTAFTGNVPGTYDPDFDLVQVLLHGNGADGITSMVDDSPYHRTVTPNGNAKISTAQSRFGGSSIAFDGVVDYLSIPYNADFAFDAGDFTIETFLYKSANNANGIRIWHPNGDYYDGVVAYIDPNGNFGAYVSTNGTSWTQSLPVVANLANGQWYHLAITRSGGSIFAFVNGVKYTVTTALGTSVLYTNAAYGRVIGGQAGVNRALNGYVDEFRITRSKARYTENFVPPTQEFLNNGQVLSSADIGHTTGDLQSITNAAGHVTQFTQYDQAGRVRQMVDTKGVVTDTAYTPRGWVASVTTTAPGGVGRTTSYTYDGVGQLTQVSQPDGTSLGYSYDAAHRLVGVTDARGNAVSYTLDNVGNRIAEEVRDPTGALQRSISRSFDALNRLQQVSGAAQ